MFGTVTLVAHRYRMPTYVTARHRYEVPIIQCYESFLGTKKRLVLLPKGAGSFVSNPIFEYRVKLNFCYVTYRVTAVLRSRL